MSGFIDYCSDCGEPATSWLANRPGEAWCHQHVPVTAAASIDWGGCGYCAFAYDSAQPGLYITHLESHVRNQRDELMVAGMKQRDLEAQLRTAGEALVAAGRELIGGAA